MTSQRCKRIRLAALLTGLLWLGSSAGAHEIRPAIIDLNLSADGRYELVMQLNLEALMAGIGPQHSDTENAPQAEEYNRLRTLEPVELEAGLEDYLPELREGFSLRADGTEQTPEWRGVEIPPVGDLELARDSQVRFAGSLPSDTEALTWQWSGTFGANALRVTGPDGDDLHTAYLQDGRRSEQIEVSGALQSSIGLRASLYLVVGGVLALLIGVFLVARLRSRR